MGGEGERERERGDERRVRQRKVKGETNGEMEGGRLNQRDEWIEMEGGRERILERVIDDFI